MKRVYKYKEKLNDIVTFTLPCGAEILSVYVQDDHSGEVCLWALVDPELLPSINRKIRIAGTGHPIEDAPQKYRKYINTFTMMNGALWFHAFEVL